MIWAFEGDGAVIPGVTWFVDRFDPDHFKSKLSLTRAGALVLRRRVVGPWWHPSSAPCPHGGYVYPMVTPTEDTGIGAI